MELYITSEDQAKLYSQFRPSPPDELVAKIISFLKEKFDGDLETAIDVGCGSGQSTVAIAPYFKNVFGVDNCSEQIDEANNQSQINNVSFRLGSSENLDFPENSIQLVTAAQCAQYFDMPKFYSQVDKVLQKNGVLAIFGYCLPIPLHESVSLEHIVKKMYENTLYEYNSDASRLVYLGNYNTKDFEQYPFCDQPTIREEFLKVMPDSSVEKLVGYAKSWSGFQRLKRTCGEVEADRVITNFQNEIMKTLNKEDEKPDNVKLTITFKYFLLLGRKV